MKMNAGETQNIVVTYDLNGDQEILNSLAA